MAHLDALRDQLLAAPPEQRLELFMSFPMADRAALVHFVHDEDELHQLEDLFGNLSVENLARLLHELELEVCREIFDLLDERLRQDIMQHLFTIGDTNDLLAALNSVPAGEVITFLEAVPPESRFAIFEQTDGEQQVEVLLQLHHQDKSEDFRKLLDTVEPADIADFLEALGDADRDAIFHILRKADQADALVELEAPVAADVIHDMDNAEFASLAKLMAADEIVELLNDLDDERRAEQILASLPNEKRDEVTGLLQYEEDSAGEIMTPEICALPKTATVADTRQALKQVRSDDPIHYVYVTEPDDGSLMGIVSLMEIIVAPAEARLESICQEAPVFATPDEDQEEIARKFRKYDLWVMPVVDGDRKLIGRITVDDVMDVVREEADEDLAKMVGAPDIEDEDDSPVRITRKRLPWLMITMIAGLVNSIIIRTMMRVTTIDAIAIFVPAILAMGGNTGMQSSAVCVRGIALGMEKYRHLRQLVSREIMVGLCLGLACGLTSGAIVYLVLTAFNGSPVGIAPGRLALVVGLAMLNAMTFAAVFGTLAPIILHRLGADPAVASGPFVTTSNDLSASLIYFATCVVLLMGVARGPAAKGQEVPPPAPPPATLVQPQ